MNKSKKNKKNNSKNTLIIVAVLLLILLIGGTYAWLKITVLSDKTHILRAGKLNLVFNDDINDGISLINTVPMSDAKGLRTNTYDFTLENNGTMDSYYTIYLDDIPLKANESRMEDKFVKYALKKDAGIAGITTAVPTLLTTSNVNGKRVLDSGVIKRGETFKYKFQIWISSDADTRVMNTIFYGKLRVEATQKSDFIVQDAIFTETGAILPYLSSENINSVSCQIGTSENNYTITGIISNGTCVVNGLTDGQTYYYNLVATKDDSKLLKEYGSFTFKSNTPSTSEIGGSGEAGNIAIP